MKKTISIVLAVLMVAFLLPLNAINTNAAGENSVNIVAEGDFAKVYKEIFNKYSRFKKAYSNLTDEGNALARLKGPLIKDDVIRAEDMKYLKTFTISNKDVNDELVRPLAFAENLEEFKVTQNDKSLRREVLDFSFIKNCKKLKVFYYQNQDINGKTEDVQKQFSKTLFTHLQSLKNIEDIRINSVELKDVNSFRGLNLKTLSLQEDEINDISAIAGININDRLDLDNNKISDISSLSHLNELVTLYLLGNPIEDISALSNLGNLEALHLRGTKVRDISPLKNLSKLHRLYIDKCENLKSDYMNIVKELAGINTLFLSKINLDDFGWLKKFAIREAVDAKYGEDKIRLFNFDELKIDLEVNPEEIIDGKVIIDNPLKDWENNAVIPDETNGEFTNSNVEFKDDKIEVKMSNSNYEFSYPVYLCNYNHTYGDYGQPAEIMGNVKIIISVKEKYKNPLQVIVMRDGHSYQESITLEIFDGYNLVETVELNQGMGAVTTYKVGKTYTVKLKDNDKYELVTGFMKVVAKDGMVGAHFLESEDEEATDDNGIVLKIKDKEVEPEQPKKPLDIMVMKDDAPSLESLTLEIFEGENLVETVNIANGRGHVKTYEVGKTYTVKLKGNDKYELVTGFMKAAGDAEMAGAHFLKTIDEEISFENAAFVKIKDKKAEEEPDQPTTENLDELTIKVKVDDQFKEGIQLRVNLWDGSIPTIISQPKTDANGTVVLKDLQANAKYTIIAGLKKYTFNPDTIEVLTDEDGKIKSVNKKEATEYRDGIVIEGHSQASEPTKIVNVPVKTVDKKTDKPVAGVEITANIINPLSSFKNFTSDEQGNIDLKLEGTQEGRVYALTVSKNDQFNWDFEPELIEVKVFEDRYEILSSKGNENKGNIFKVTKNDRNHLRKDLKDLIEKAEALIASGKYTDESLADLKVTVQGGKAELAKAETIPYYVEGHIENINTAIKKLAVKEQPQKPVVPDYNGGWGYYEPTPSDNYWKKPVVEAKAEPKKEEKKAEAKKEVKTEPVVITSKFTLDSMNFGVNDSNNTMDVAPFAKDGRIMVPIRFVGMALGFDVSWDDATKTAILKDGKTEIRIPMNGKTFYVNGVAFEADAEPEIRSERIFLSISNIAKALGLEEGKTIFWDQATKTASFIFNK